MSTEDLTPAPEGIDMEATADSIAEDLGFSPVEPEPETKEPAPAPASATEPQAATAPAQPEGTPSPTAAPDDRPPDTWKRDMQERWAGLPPEVKAEVRRREADIAKYVGETKDHITIAKAFERVIEPHARELEQAGIDPWQHMSGLLAAHKALTQGSVQDKLAALQGLATQAGVDLRGVATGDPRQANAQVLQYVRQLEQKVSNLEKGVTGVTTEVQAARAAELEANVLTFAQDEKAHPYFWDVTDQIQHLIATGAATTLQQAYDLAVLANPQTKQKILDAEATRRMEDQRKMEVARAAKAAKAAGANVRASGRGKPPPAAGSIDDTLRETLAEINSRT